MVALTVWSICVSKANWLLLKCGVGIRFRQRSQAQSLL